MFENLSYSQRIKRKIKVVLRDFELQYYYYKYKKAVVLFDPSLFKGKRVALVGSANSAYLKKNGEFIDSFDVVVRVNKGVEQIDMYSDYIGKRTDVLFHSLNLGDDPYTNSPLTLELWHINKVKHIQYSYHYSYRDSFQLKKFLKVTKGKLKIGVMNKKFHNLNFSAVEPYYPTNGFIALNTILNSDPHELFVTGITFFKTPYVSGYREGDEKYWKNFFQNNIANHNPNSEFLHVLRKYRSSSNILKVDETLNEIFESYS